MMDTAHDVAPPAVILRRYGPFTRPGYERRTACHNAGGTKRWRGGASREIGGGRPSLPPELVHHLDEVVVQLLRLVSGRLERGGGAVPEVAAHQLPRDRAE